jgi:hypothetical protein
VAQDALNVFSGMYGSVWRDNIRLGEVIEFSGTVGIGRIDVPLVGQTRVGHKPGRETREGTMRVQKRDAKWEMEIYNFFSQSLDDRRASRDAGAPSLRPFSLICEYDDPDALGRERWQFDGCLIWNLPLGMSIADDQVERDYTITWESERPLEVFEKVVGPGGVAAPRWIVGPTP